MRFLRRFAPQTITAQIACLVIAAVVLGVGLASAVLLYLFYSWQGGPNFDSVAAVRAARIAAIVREAEASSSPVELDDALKTARRRNIDVEAIAIAHMTPAPEAGSHHSAFGRAVKTALEDSWGIVALSTPAAAVEDDSILVKVSDDNALKFRISPPRGALRNLVLVQTICALAIVLFIIVFLSLYAVYGTIFSARIYTSSGAPRRATCEV